VAILPQSAVSVGKYPEVPAFFDRDLSPSISAKNG
jgi:hypothetical protein